MKEPINMTSYYEASAEKLPLFDALTANRSADVCIVGGGIVNLIDRFRFGHVTDFFHIDLGGVFKTGIFNVADMSVMLGLGLLIFSSFKSKKIT